MYKIGPAFWYCWNISSDCGQRSASGLAWQCCSQCFPLECDMAVLKLMCAGRSKLWSSMPQLFSRAYSSEGFALNLCYVLLRLSQPFAKPLSPKLLKIQPSYTAVVVADDAEANAIGVHAKGMSCSSCSQKRKTLCLFHLLLYFVKKEKNKKKTNC